MLSSNAYVASKGQCLFFSSRQDDDHGCLDALTFGADDETSTFARTSVHHLYDIDQFLTVCYRPVAANTKQERKVEYQQVQYVGHPFPAPSRGASLTNSHLVVIARPQINHDVFVAIEEHG